MLVSLHSNAMLILNKFSVTNRIVDQDVGNTQKTQLIPMRGFDYETFPFVVSPGMKSINLINVRENTMQSFVQSGMCY